MHRIMSFGTDYRDSVGINRAKDSQRCVSAHWRRIWVWNWRILRERESCRESEFDPVILQLFWVELFSCLLCLWCRGVLQLELPWNKRENTWKVTLWISCRWWKVKLSLSVSVDHCIDFVAMDVAVNAAAGALKAFFADLPDPLIPYSLHPELVEAASKNEHNTHTHTHEHSSGHLKRDKIPERKVKHKRQETRTILEQQKVECLVFMRISSH